MIMTNFFNNFNIPIKNCIKQINFQIPVEKTQLNNTLISRKEIINKVLNGKIISDEQLEKIFSGKKSDASLNISNAQKASLRSVLIETTLAPDVKESLKKFSYLFKQANTDDINERYSFSDIMFNSKFYDTFKKYCEEENLFDNFCFIHDLKNALESPDTDILKDIYQKYIKTGSIQKIKISEEERKAVEKKFENSDNLLELLKSLEVPSVTTIRALKNEVFPKFRREKMKEIVRIDYLEIPKGVKRVIFLQSLIKVHHPAAEVAKALIREDIEKVTRTFMNPELLADSFIQ
jgi:hypothetical protein